jgi:hypothetical protein
MGCCDGVRISSPSELPVPKEPRGAGDDRLPDSETSTSTAVPLLGDLEGALLVMRGAERQPRLLSTKPKAPTQRGLVLQSGEEGRC